MAVDTSSFGRMIASRRKELKMSQKDLAARIRKEDGEPITPQYLNDIEHDRRSPSSDHMVKEFARVLDMKADVLYLVAGRVPGDIKRDKISPQKMEKAVALFRKALQ